MENAGQSLDVNKILGAIILVIIAVLVYLNWDKISALWKGVPETTPLATSTYDDCVAKNKALADGADCVNCVQVGSAQAAFNGTISGGVCQPKPTLAEGSACTVKVNNVMVNGTIVGGVCQPTLITTTTATKVEITNPAGARTLIYNGKAFQSPANAYLINAGSTVIVLQSITSPHTYYRTQFGWIDGDDAQVV